MITDTLNFRCNNLIRAAILLKNKISKFVICPTHRQVQALIIVNNVEPQIQQIFAVPILPILNCKQIKQIIIV